MNRIHGSRPRALVVDDDPSVSLALNFLLASIGWETVEADHANPALDELARNRFDLIRLDLKMPDINGIELCSLIRAQKDLPAPAIMILSGYISPASEAAAMAAGATAVREKPIGREELMELLRQHDLPCDCPEIVPCSSSSEA